MDLTVCKLSRVAFGVACGILWGVGILLIGLVAHFAHYGTTFVTSMGGLYIGYGPSIFGSIVGGLIGFIDAFIVGFLLAWIYNAVAHCGCKQIEKKKTVGKKA